jgi:D-alanyl-D-alanine carboxypeptidase/D-alanyl-D-alanine-endopeptidase (penicillin-binding protein 4)
LKVFLFVSGFLLMASVVTAHGFESFESHIGENEAILLAGPDGDILYSKNADQEMIPASTIKLLTSLASFHFLGKDYRFKTECYLDNQQNLVIKGFGDPLLISEVVDEIAASLASLSLPAINNLLVDDSHFSQPLIIPGISSTSRPYDAPNGALCVNFNTVNFRHGPVPGTYISAEPQTPLLPFALERIKQSGHQSNRIVLSHHQNDITLYAGHMFGYFLRKHGVNIHGNVHIGKVSIGNGRLILRYESGFTLEQVSRELLEYSNNFIANQLLVAMGAKKYGSPGNLRNGVDAVKSYAQNQLGIHQMALVEGSGISRKNRICAKNMLKILEAFRPHYHLMRKEKNVFFKTGTLHGVSNLAGFIQNANGRLYPFVIFINRTGKSSMPLMEMLMRKVN